MEAKNILPRRHHPRRCSNMLYRDSHVLPFADPHSRLRAELKIQKNITRFIPAQVDVGSPTGKKTSEPPRCHHHPCRRSILRASTRCGRAAAAAAVG